VVKFEAGRQRHLLDAGTGTEGLALGDLNADGLVDIVTSGTAGVGVFMSQGLGAFSTRVAYTTTYGSWCELVDLNEDGVADIVSHYSRRVRLREPRSPRLASACAGLAQTRRCSRG
jgi:hypothetical protein